MEMPPYYQWRHVLNSLLFISIMMHTVKGKEIWCWATRNFPFLCKNHDWTAFDCSAANSWAVWAGEGGRQNIFLLSKVIWNLSNCELHNLSAKKVLLATGVNIILILHYYICEDYRLMVVLLYLWRVNYPGDSRIYLPRFGGFLQC
jgi:hypothetical protein